MRVALLFAVVLSALSVQAAYPSSTRVSGPDFDGVILDLPSTRPGIAIWIPGYDQILSMEKALPEYVRNYIREKRIVLRKPISKYKRQYVGVRDDGRRLIGVSFYHENLDFITSKKWLNGVWGGDSAGDDYMGAVYDVEKQAFELFEIYPVNK